MSFLARVARNVTRRKFRTVAVALVVGLVLGIFLILSTISNGIEQNIDNAKAAVANIITVTEPSSGGSGGGFGGAFAASTPLPESVVPIVEHTADVESVERILTKVVEPAGCSSGPSGGFGCFRNSTTYQGVDTNASTGVQLFAGFGASSISITSGENLQASDENLQVAIVGQTYATNNNVILGTASALISVNGTSFNIIGIFSTGSMFGGNEIVMPFPAASAALNIPGPDLLYVDVNGVANVGAVQQAINAATNDDYDVSQLASPTGGGFESSIDNVVSSAQLEGYVALSVGAVVMVVVMALVTMGRTREIGLLKAFGFTNPLIFTQLLAESFLWALPGLPIGLAISYWLGPTIAEDLAQSAAQSAFGGSSSGGHFSGGGGFAAGFADHLVGTLDWNITGETLALGILVTVVFAVVGAAYPILRALRLKPMEALRNE